MMSACNSLHNTDDGDSISLLTTILIRYPQICSVIYTQQGSRLQLRFILNYALSKEELKEFQAEIYNCHKAYIYFAKLESPQIFKLEYQEGAGIGVVEIVRDAASLTRQEIDFFIAFMQQRFPAQLVYDDLDLPENDLDEQDNIISYTLDKLKAKFPQYNLMAVREEGRVLVFKR